jgi:hypothetical protein
MEAAELRPLSIGELMELFLRGRFARTFAPFVDELVIWVLISAVAIVLAGDQRLRAEGSDLEAELDAMPP